MYYGALFSYDDGYVIFVQTDDIKFFQKHPEYVFYELDDLRCLQDIQTALTGMSLNDIAFGARRTNATTVEVIISEKDNDNIPDGFVGPFDSIGMALGFYYMKSSPELAIQLMLDVDGP